MTDIEKVIKGLAYCTRPSEVGKGGNFCMDCPYTEPIGFNQFKCNGQQMMGDALVLLKEQETVEHAKEILCANGWEKMRFPEGTIGKWDDPDIVRCKDCKYRSEKTYTHGITNKEVFVCQINDLAKEPDWFCADGERRTE